MQTETCAFQFCLREVQLSCEGPLILRCQLMIMNLILIKNDAGSNGTTAFLFLYVKCFINSTGYMSFTHP